MTVAPFLETERFPNLHRSGPDPVRVLIIDDDAFMRATAREVLENQGFETLQAASGEEGLRVFERNRPDVVLLDVRMPGMDGYETCSRLRSLASGRFTPILMATGLDDLDSIENAYRAGATDFEMKPLQWTVVSQRIGYMLCAAHSREAEMVRQQDERRRLKGELKELKLAVKEARMIYRSAAMESVIRVARRVSPTDATILISGESGTGKDLMAQTLHKLSDRRDQPLVTVDCGAIPVSLIESELFGHEKGAYTGATGRRVGRLAEADGGTVFLDEIGELPLEVQSKLLRFVQERQVVPVGSSKARQVDVRVLAATNRNLQADVEAGKFREDLYFRLNVINLVVPALRERPEDVLFLARHFVERYAVQYQRDIRGLTSAAEQLLVEHQWPGNVRELQNRILQAVILADPGELGVADLDLETRHGRGLVAVSSPVASSVPATATEEAKAEAGDPLHDLRRSLKRLVDTALDNDSPAPIGRWLYDELVLVCYEAARRKLRPAARLAGLPSSTFRRRLQKAEAGMVQNCDRVEGWDAVAFDLETLIERRFAPPEGADTACERLLTELICHKYPGQTKLGASLSGVSAPTFRKRARALPTDSSQADPS